MNAIVAPQCPRCGGELLPIVWGMPDQDTWEAGERGELYIGGCIVPADPWPRRACNACHYETTDA